MLCWTLVFLLLAIVSGGLGFTGVSQAASGIAQILFWIFLVLLVLSLLLPRVRGRAERVA